MIFEFQIISTVLTPIIIEAQSEQEAREKLQGGGIDWQLGDSEFPELEILLVSCRES